MTLRAVYPRITRQLRRPIGSPRKIGDQTRFYGQAIAGVPFAAVRYRGEVVRLIAEISMGSGVLAMIGGTVVIVGFLTLASGGTLAVQGFSSLGNIGIEALTGFLAAFINVRIVAPVVAGIGLAATFGAGVTAQLGSMRIAEEIDALEAMAIRSVPFLVSSRIAAGMIAVVPLYAIAVILSFFASRFVTVFLFGQSGGLYDHYFTTFLNPIDLLWSFLQAILIALAILLGAHLLRLLHHGWSVRRRCRGGRRGADLAYRRGIADFACVTSRLRLQRQLPPVGLREQSR